MLEIKVKEEFKAEVIGYRGSSLPLGERTQDHLIELAIIAQSYNPGFKRFFEDLPSIEELKEASGEIFIAENSGSSSLNPPDASSRYDNWKETSLLKELKKRDIPFEPESTREVLIQLLVANDALKVADSAQL